MKKDIKKKYFITLTLATLLLFQNNFCGEIDFPVPCFDKETKYNTIHNTIILFNN